jgi:MSHA pilin protein MshD
MHYKQLSRPDKNLPRKLLSARRPLSSALCPLPSDRGFTLIELVMTIVILGFLSMILVPFFSSITHSPDPMVRQQAVALGQAIMDEIQAKKWDENTPPGGGPIDTAIESNGRGTAVNASTIGRDDASELADDRTTWDDVDDYDGLNESNSFTDQNHTSFTLNGYTRTVTVRYILSPSNPITGTIPPGATDTGASTDTKRITVTVASPLGETFTLVAVMCNF